MGEGGGLSLSQAQAGARAGPRAGPRTGPRAGPRPPFWRDQDRHFPVQPGNAWRAEDRETTSPHPTDRVSPPATPSSNHVAHAMRRRTPHSVVTDSAAAQRPSERSEPTPKGPGRLRARASPVQRRRKPIAVDGPGGSAHPPLPRAGRRCQWAPARVAVVRRRELNSPVVLCYSRFFYTIGFLPQL